MISDKYAALRQMLKSELTVRCTNLFNSEINEIGELLAERDALLQNGLIVCGELNSLHAPRPMSEWHEDVGPVLWWIMPINEPPYIGTPHDSDWLDDYYTHWTPLPDAEKINSNYALQAMTDDAQDMGLYEEQSK